MSSPESLFRHGIMNPERNASPEKTALGGSEARMFRLIMPRSKVWSLPQTCSSCLPMQVGSVITMQGPHTSSEKNTSTVVNLGLCFDRLCQIMQALVFATLTYGAEVAKSCAGAYISFACLQAATLQVHAGVCATNIIAWTK